MAMINLSRPSAPGAAPAPPRTRRLAPYALLTPGALWLVVFFGIPIVSLFFTATQTKVPGTYGSFVQSWNFGIYPEMLGRFYPQLLRSFQFAGTATVAALLLGFPLAYAIAFKAGRWRNVLLVLVVAPFFCSFLLRTVAWRIILADQGWIVQTLRGLHLLGAHQSLNIGAFTVVCGLTYNFLPFMTLPLYSALERIDPRLLEAGADLYGSPAAVLFKVTLPLAAPGIMAGTMLTFIPAAGDYVNATMLGSTRTRMIGNVIEARFFGIVDYPGAAALSFVLMACILLIVVVYLRRSGTEELV